MMLALGIRYLNGWAMAAADGARKEEAEWPPHPDRVFMALAAAWFETGEDPAEGAALEWLQQLVAPELDASDARRRATGSSGSQPVSYVPVNDGRVSKRAPSSTGLAKLKDAGLSLLPEHRGRQGRHFPIAVPLLPTVYLVWPAAEPGAHTESLETLAAKVANIGHSASLVQVWLTRKAIQARWVPTDGIAQRRLRIPAPGRLEYLRRRCNRDAVIGYRELQHRIGQAKGKEKKMLQAELEEYFGADEPVSLRPEPGLWQGYAERAPATAPGLPAPVFDPRLLVFSIASGRLPLNATLRFMDAMRCTLLKDIADARGAEQTDRANSQTQPSHEQSAHFDYPEWLSGHRADRSASKQPHLAFAPLPFVGAPHADGHLLGIALILPRDLDQAEAARWLKPWVRRDSDGLPPRIRVFDGRHFETEIELELRDGRPQALRPESWTAAGVGACRWASVTPIVLDRHFKGTDKWQKAAESVKTACERIGLPRPLAVELHPVSKHRGVPRANDFSSLHRKSDGGRMQHTHAFIQFAEPVVGPVAVGAGRFRGYGFCKPLNDCRRPAKEAAND
ncbi:type I-U CRISPR-associated protein Cas5/Cas6 [Thiohalocapsa halophila]|uniref:Type I-U CRISPR-associated protein Cas5/Cas6 n=1 Tax=Thiohalocapsa halophila TaxID=69359 RepID=A0ABS1CJS2_9GAMM|nr:type I-U CRISPR-associated protein Csb2 [Thiohalocapsa halophila]MBK1632155.1 type I-U CRISPR-associated protein Cas5/Cas6 [Thiohalocapsa halophila]